MIERPQIEGLHFVEKKLSGGAARWYVYAWRGGPQIMSSDGKRKPQLTDKALKELTRVREERDAGNPTGEKTLLSLIRKWRSCDPARPSSPEWEALAATTKKTWGSALNRIEEKWGKVPLELFNDTRMIEKVINWRDSRAATASAADNGITVLRALLKFGIQRGLLKINVAVGIRQLYQNGQRAEIVWTPDDLAAFEQAAKPEEVNVVDAVLLDSVTGLRREDVARLTWQGVGAFAIVRKAAKRSRGKRRFATIPRIPELDQVLDRLRDRPRAAGVETVLVTAEGYPWNLDTLTKAVTKIVKRARILHVDPDADPAAAPKRKHLHDVRGTFATKLMTTTDLTNDEIADIMGWSPEEVANIRRIYVDDGARTVALGRRIARGV